MKRLRPVPYNPLAVLNLIPRHAFGSADVNVVYWNVFAWVWGAGCTIVLEGRV